MEPLHLACPVGTAKGAKECPVTLELLALADRNAVPRNRADPVTLTTLVQMLGKIDPCFVACHDMHGTKIDVPTSL